MSIAVAVDVGPLHGSRTGIGAAVGELRNALAARDDVTVLPYLTSFRARPEPGVIRLPLPAAVAHRLWSRTGHPRVDRWLGGAQVVHGTNYVVPPCRLPRLVSVYDCWFLDHPDQAHPDVRRAGRVLRRSIADGAVVHASSQATASAIERHFPGARVETILLASIHLGPPAEYNPVPELAGHPFVLSVATLEQRKNLTTLVSAFGRLAGENRSLRLVLAGANGDDRQPIERAIERLPADAQGRVLLTGYVHDADRSWLLHNARVLAYPSLDEGFGFPLLDAMQAGVPIVASAAGSIPEVAGDAALLGDARDAAGLASNLRAALFDDDTRSRLLAAAPDQLARFTWRDTAARFSDLYARLAGGSG
jgi:glycosyltransferase involved in cell wall biosynthesis